MAAPVTGKGVGALTAVSLLASMPELGTLNRHQVAALWPASSRRSTGIPAPCAANGRFYGGRHAARQVAGGKARKVAPVAIMRGLLIHLNSIMSKVLQREREAYHPGGKNVCPPCW